jgi:hypothetical protein
VKDDIKKIGCVDWIVVAQDSPETGSFEHGDEPSGSMKGGEFLD